MEMMRMRWAPGWEWVDGIGLWFWELTVVMVVVVVVISVVVYNNTVHSVST